MSGPQPLVSIEVAKSPDYANFYAVHEMGGFLLATADYEETLRIDQVQVTGERRRGIASDLVRTTVRSVIEMPETRNVEFIVATITNPATLDLINKIFGEGLAKYFEDNDYSVPILGICAAKALIRERQMVFSELSDEEITDGIFDQGISVIVPIIGIDMSEWPLVKLA